jgi:hypothetical protein
MRDKGIYHTGGKQAGYLSNPRTLSITRTSGRHSDMVTESDTGYHGPRSGMGVSPARSG